MKYSKLKQIVGKIADSYTEKTRDDGIRFLVSENLPSELEELEKNCRYEFDSSLSGMDFAYRIASYSMNILRDYLDSIDDIQIKEEVNKEEILDNMNDFIFEQVDSLCIYTSDNERIIMEYGLGNALEEYENRFGTEQGLNSARLAFNILEENITHFLGIFLKNTIE